MNPSELIQLLVDISGTDEVRSNPQLPLFETQVLDSMRVVELIVELDAKYGVTISPAEFDRANWATPEKFVADIESRLTATV